MRMFGAAAKALEAVRRLAKRARKMCGIFMGRDLPQSCSGWNHESEKSTQKKDRERGPFLENYKG